jgi:hypothetical protein
MEGKGMSNKKGVLSQPQKARRLRLQEVVKMKSLLERYSNKELAEQFSVTIGTVWRIRHGLAWKWVTPAMEGAFSGRSTN